MIYVIYKLLSALPALKVYINSIIEKISYHLFLFVMTDVLKNGSTVLVLGSSTKLVEIEFDITLNNGAAWLDKIILRKSR